MIFEDFHVKTSGGLKNHKWAMESNDDDSLRTQRTTIRALKGQLEDTQNQYQQQSEEHKLSISFLSIIHN